MFRGSEEDFTSDDFFNQRQITAELQSDELAVRDEEQLLIFLDLLYGYHFAIGGDLHDGYFINRAA